MTHINKGGTAVSRTVLGGVFILAGTRIVGLSMSKRGLYPDFPRHLGCLRRWSMIHGEHPFTICSDHSFDCRNKQPRLVVLTLTSYGLATVAGGNDDIVLNAYVGELIGVFLKTGCSESWHASSVS